jgi:malate permease and related proteins
VAWRILGIITPVVLIILVGWLYARRAHPDMSGINRAIMEVIAPLLVVSSFVGKDFELVGQWRLLVGGLAVIGGSGLLAWPIARLAGVDRRTFVPPMMFNNCGNMGLPLAVFAFGDRALAPMVALFVVSGLTQFTVGVKLVDPRASLRGVLSHPMVLASAAGIVLSATKNLMPLPVPLYSSMKLLGDAAVPLMLFSLGVRMKDMDLRHWRVGLLGGVACPAVGLVTALLVARFLALTPLQFGLLFVYASLPPAVFNFLMADHHQQEPELVASIVFLGTILSVFFVPAGLYLGLR